jgi:gliding motility-associated-like protein
MIGQSFSVSSINDVAKLEFDFIPTSDTITFRYVFGSQEYFAFENTSYNDVFGFFLSGPGISGPYANGAENLAIVPGSNPPLPITISSVNSVTPINQQYFVNNQNGLDTIADADGLTTVLTAVAVVQCGQTYHIRLAIADGSDQGLSSYVWLEAGSFKSPVLNVTDNLGFDSTYMEIPCNSSVMLTADGGTGATYEWINETGMILSTNSSVVVGPGKYLVSATSSGCAVISDTITIVGDVPPSFDLGADVTIPCNTQFTLTPVITGGTGNYSYKWNINTPDSTSSSISVSEGFYKLTIDDGTGCLSEDSITITEENPPTTIVSGGGNICEDGSSVNVIFSFDGVTPWDLTYSDGSSSFNQNGINSPIYNLVTSDEGTYFPTLVEDVNDCISELQDSVIVNIYELPVAIITPSEITIYEGEVITLEVGNYQLYEWYNSNDSLLSVFSDLSVPQAGEYYVFVTNENNCTDTSEVAIVNTVPLTELYIPNTFTPNGDNNNELFVVHGLNIKNFKMDIVDRWGELVYQTTDMYKYWDGKFNGKLIPEGIYMYSIEILGKDMKEFNKIGTIQIIY